MRTLDDLQQMCDAPSDAYSAGAWCEAANDLLVHALESERRFIEVCGEGMAADAEVARLQTIHDADCTIHYCQPPWRCSCGRAQAERAVAEAATLRQALSWYADTANWTQPTSWGGRIFDDEGAAVADCGERARAALAAGEASR